MKVVFVAPYTLPFRAGGFETQVYQIFKELRGLGVDVLWHNLEDSDLEDVDILQIMAAEPSMIPMMRMAKNKGVKVVLTPQQGSRAKSNRYLKACLSLSKIPQLCSMHKLMCATIRCADFLTPLCSFEAQRMTEVYGFDRDHIRVIPNGLDRVFFDDAVADVEIPCKEYLLTVGRIEENKNQLTLIDVVKNLGMNLIIVGGPGSSGSDYLEKCKKAANNRVYFWGVERDPLVVKQLYRNTRLTVIPSYSEMLPLVAFESLSQHTPVVCTDRCGITGEDIPGLCFSDISVKALTESILSMRSFDGGTITDKGIYTWADIAGMYKDVYEELLK